MTVRDLIVKLTATGELNREVVFARIEKVDPEFRRPILVTPLFPVERLFLGEDQDGPYVALLE